MNKHFIFCLFLIAIAAFSSAAFAQINYSGKSFAITLGGDSSLLYYYDHDSNDITLVSKYKATVQLHFTNTGQTVTYVLNPNEVKNIPLSHAQLMATSNMVFDQVRKKSLIITADSNINVHLLSWANSKDADAMVILPSDHQPEAKEYFLLGYNKNGAYGRHSYSIVANCDNVQLEITPSAKTDFHPAYIPYTVTLNKGETYQIGTTIPGGAPPDEWDISGTYIKVLSSGCCVPVNIFCTFPAVYVNWPPVHNPGVGTADKILEQIPPVDWWDKEYAMVSWERQTRSVLRVISSVNNNRIFYNGILVTVLNKGQIFDTLVHSTVPAVVKGDNPIGIAQYMLSDGMEPDTVGDPEMQWVYSLKQGIKDAIFKCHVGNTILYSDTPYYTLTIISKTADKDSVSLNNVYIGNQFQQFSADTSWCYTIVHLPHDTSILYHLKAKEKVIAYYLEQEMQGSCGYDLSELDSIDAVELTSLADTTEDCSGNPITLLANTATSYLWSTGATTQQITVLDTGVYKVTEFNNATCITSFRQHFFYVISRPDTLLFFDTIRKCAYVDTILTAEPAQVYEWSTGATTQQITAAGNGLYINIAKTHDTCGWTYKIHSFYITTKAVDSIYRADTLYKCPLEEVQLSGPFAEHYLWSTGDTGVSIRVRDTGLYVVTGTIADTCGKYRVHSYYLINKMQDTTWMSEVAYKCAGQPLVLTADTAWKYQWTTGDTTRSTVISDTGLYTVTETITGACTTHTLHTYIVRDTAYDFHISSGDTIICMGDEVILHTGYDATVWSTGELGESIHIKDSGLYFATVTDPCDVVYHDTVQIGIDSCLYRYCNISFPNVFTPNADGKNDVFRCILYGELSAYKLEIFDRFGERVFATEQVRKGWDGKYKGDYMELGTYFYQCHVTCIEGKRLLKGDFMLIR